MAKATTSAVILCGGLGTRLSTITSNKPKPMVDVAGVPFLEHQFNYLLSQGITRAILAVSHLKECIIDYFGSQYKNLHIEYVSEDIPLGTGGAIKNVLTHIEFHPHESIVILNGDTFVEFSLPALTQDCANHLLVIAAKSVDDTARYGKLTIDDSMLVTGFHEKKAGTRGYINAGVYMTSPELLAALPDLEHFSFEEDFLHHEIAHRSIGASILSGFFIDIGIPDDYYAFCDLMGSGQIQCPS
ncbi:nucleotidyltransferase family protein [Photobacterium kagoshimensis]|uniref:nucleotidyltransferase family protein n=1 Tax=Photobacterium kagoshimensis TaxID=2910242 RepID=UPI003D0F9905